MCTATNNSHVVIFCNQKCTLSEYSSRLTEDHATAFHLLTIEFLPMKLSSQLTDFSLYGACLDTAYSFQGEGKSRGQFLLFH